MGLNASECLSLTAIVISLASTFYAKKQSDHARAAARNDYRAHLADNHEKYRVALKQVDSKHKEDITSISREAGRALTVVVGIFDMYDTGEEEPRRLRHIVHECSEMVYYAFRGQLGWQSGLNISHRLSRISRIEDYLEPEFNHYGQDSYQEKIRYEYFANKNEQQENRLLKDNYFCSLVGQIQTRTNSECKAELLMKIQEELKPLRSLFQKIIPDLEKSAQELDDMLADGKQEVFPLQESPWLFLRLQYRQATLETLTCFSISEIDTSTAARYQGYVSLCINICAILHAIEGFHSWGWDVGDFQIR